MPNESLVDVLLPAYCCQRFGQCPDAKWHPSEGHVPRGFLGATGELEDVEVIMVLAEPAKPKNKKGLKESYEHRDSNPKGTLEQVVEFVYGCYEMQVSRLHRNARMFLEWRYGDEVPFDAQLWRVWITEARLCSISKATADPGAEAYGLCEDRYLARQIERLPRAQVVAFGKKAERAVENLWRVGRLRQNPIVAGSLASYGNRLAPARESWKVALRQLRPPSP